MKQIISWHDIQCEPVLKDTRIAVQQNFNTHLLNRKQKNKNSRQIVLC